MILPGLPDSDVIRLLCIDPGTDTLGIAILDIQLDTFEPTLVFGHTLKASKDIDEDVTMCEMRGARDARLLSHYRNLYHILVATEPTLIAAESPFLQRGKVSAYEALVECYAMLRACVWEYSPTLLLRRIDPITAKNYCGVSHIGTGKEDVRKAILNIYESRCGSDVDIRSLDEHTMDAVAVANALYRKYLLGEVIESTKRKKKRGGKRRKRGKK